MLLSEMCGVARGKLFTTENYKGYEFRIESCGGAEYIEYRPKLGEWRDVKLTMLENIIDLAPSGIIHLPLPLTDKQREQLKAIWTLGGRWLAKDSSMAVNAFVDEPVRHEVLWTTVNKYFAVCATLAVCSLVSWSDNEPYDIGKALGVGK